MCSLLVILEVVLMMAIANGNGVPSNQAPLPTKSCVKTPENICTCHCSLHQDSSLNETVKALETKVEELIKVVNSSFISGSSPPQAIPVSSCKEQLDKNNSSKSQVYELTFGPLKVAVYCHMENFGCGDGGWTLAMKTDGTKTTFRYDSDLWTSQNSYNLEGGTTGFDTQETKLPTYWSTPFSKICLGMKLGHQIKFITINQNANSLYSLIADGSFRTTSLRRDTWKTLIGHQASLERFCNKEGFNAQCSVNSASKARIGILGNDQDSCASCDSRIGFGMGGSPHDTNTCGNDAASGADNGVQNIKTMGYVLVQ